MKIEATTGALLTVVSTRSVASTCVNYSSPLFCPGVLIPIPLPQIAYSESVDNVTCCTSGEDC
jgi:hypothetical protein